MKANERRKEIVALLFANDSPVSGRVLSEKFGASRQIIVQDIAILKAEGHDIISTNRGYVLKSSPAIERVFKLRHTSDQTADELTCIVDLGGTVVDVFVWHKVYGKIAAKMNIFSRLGVEHFMEGIKSGKSTELMNITSGYHYHTVRAESQQVLDDIANALEQRGYLVEGE